MTRRNILFLAGLLLALLPPPPASAGSVGGSFDLLYWVNRSEVSALGRRERVDGNFPGARGSLRVTEKLGFNLGYYRSDLDGDDLGSVQYVNLDALWAFIRTDEDAYLGAGLGYQNVSYNDAGPFDGSSSGLRVVFEGRVSFFYGKFAWMPSLGSFDSGSLSFSSISGTEWEVGAFYPFGRFRAFVGYRNTLVQLTARAGSEEDANADAETGGFLLGLGVDF
jgi:hypothetical protein